MPNYKYTATDESGREVRGTLAAGNVTELASRLREQGRFLMNSEEKKESRSFAKLKALEISEFCRELGAMLSSGVSLIRALNIMMQRDLKPRIRVVYEGLYQCLQRGMLLSEAMSEQGNAFPVLLVNMYRAAESSGTLDTTSAKMAEYYQKEHRLHRKIKSATTYPKFLGGLTVLVVLALFIFVLPNFFSLYDGMELPAITQFMMSFSNFIKDYWVFVLIAILLVVLGVSFALQVPVIRLYFDRFKLKIPKVGKLLKIIYTARFARTIASLYASGLSMITVLQNSKGTVGNAYISSQFDAVIADVRQGSPLSDAMKKIKGFDAKLSATIMIGEETGRLEDMLNSTADSFDYEADAATTRLTGLLEPLLIVVMAVIVGTVMISVMVPLFGMYNQIGAGY